MILLYDSPLLEINKVKLLREIVATFAQAKVNINRHFIIKLLSIIL